MFLSALFATCLLVVPVDSSTFAIPISVNFTLLCTSEVHNFNYTVRLMEKHDGYDDYAVSVYGKVDDGEHRGYIEGDIPVEWQANGYEFELAVRHYCGGISAEDQKLGWFKETRQTLSPRCSNKKGCHYTDVIVSLEDKEYL